MEAFWNHQQFQNVYGLRYSNATDLLVNTAAEDLQMLFWRLTTSTLALLVEPMKKSI
jgi:hypothetical protein